MIVYMMTQGFRADFEGIFEVTVHVHVAGLFNDENSNVPNRNAEMRILFTIPVRC